ncbi:DUF3465 domain-containing protein [Microbacterium sp. ASV81]|uniref:DUF3465 domain-containing protein n=1 Tax=Microbacterium capsulatum TaxID=3041921 RepID=A0ABU0XHI7_9MICO|nr:DUF3465 domain-containing protein [Microbacterium sp. ASV81]MDQ4214588.1 DUF3465 domain-containing protein [Microbacterium sp. ASV81]
MTRRARWTAIAAVVAVGALAVLGVAQGWIPGGPGPVAAPSPVVVSAPVGADDPVRALFDGRRSGVEVQGAGVVTRILPDDDSGSRHQRFILTTPAGITILVAHNIDIAPRLDGLSTGDRVDFLGDYEWSDKGGTVHWTHHDPSGRHQAGWLVWRGHRYS